MAGKVVILDMDGTVVSTEERFNMCLKEVNAKSLEELKGAQRKAFWSCFLSEKYMHLDTPKDNVIRVVRELKSRGYTIHVVSGRTENQLNATIEQLQKFNVPYDKITLRRIGDYRKDYEFKGEVVRSYVEQGFEVIIIDDSADVRALLPERAYSPDNLPDPESL